jgi:erythromycin esterase-like protein
MAFEAHPGELNRAALPLTFGAEDYDALLDWIGSRRIVLIGEASHGTHDFYKQRALITRRLIEERGFNGVAIEGDWPDAHRVHRFVLGRGDDPDACAALGDFLRFPAWMWRNMDVLAFVEWLREFNLKSPKSDRVGFHGLDLYSLHASIRAVLDFLDKVDPEAARRARFRYSCFDHFGEDAEAYGYAASLELNSSCADEAVAQLVELRRRRADLASREAAPDSNDYLFAEQNARLVQNAERYYRVLFSGTEDSWNIRDRHMAESLEWLMRIRPEAKMVVWAHNSHLGDARATDMAARGEINLGQLARERYGEEVFAVGFTTYSGEVTAASNWEAPAERKVVRLALPESCESLFHAMKISRFILPLGDAAVRKILDRPMLQRAIGVIYRPDTERISHYFRSRLPDQFDAVIHLDRTRALVPFERTAGWNAGEMPETYPWAV